jgi:hypothetical protein
MGGICLAIDTSHQIHDKEIDMAKGKGSKRRAWRDRANKKREPWL